MNDYSMIEHRHRFAAWAASRAASVKGYRFKVSAGCDLIEASGLPELIRHEALPPEGAFDASHRAWRERIIERGEVRHLLTVSHGVAAKLINMYLKGTVVCANSSQASYVHPPIDTLVLEGLSGTDAGGLREVWEGALKQKWYHFNDHQYQTVIDAIREAFPGAPLWKAEAHWQGHR